MYTREAHPGEHVGHHDSFERKQANARLLRDQIGIRRPILLDALTGGGHLAYGGLPNMTWVIGRSGRILYKADWTSAANVEGFVSRYRAARRERPAGVALTPYASEQLEFRHVDREMFYDRLRHNGPRAYDEFSGPSSCGPSEVADAPGTATTCGGFGRMSVPADGPFVTRPAARPPAKFWFVYWSMPPGCPRKRSGCATAWR